MDELIVIGTLERRPVLVKVALVKSVRPLVKHVDPAGHGVGGGMEAKFIVIVPGNPAPVSKMGVQSDCPINAAFQLVEAVETEPLGTLLFIIPTKSFAGQLSSSVVVPGEEQEADEDGTATQETRTNASKSKMVVFIGLLLSVKLSLSEPHLRTRSSPRLHISS